MTNLECLRELVSLMDGLTPKNEALRVSIVTILNTLERMQNEQKAEAEPAPEVKPEQAQPKKEPEKAPAKKRGGKPFDVGKAKACRAAGRSIAKIADEMGVSDQTVRNHLQKAGVKVGATIVG